LDTALNYQAGEEAKELTSQLQTQEEKLKECRGLQDASSEKQV
jgi:hypothetical protein